MGTQGKRNHPRGGPVRDSAVLHVLLRVGGYVETAVHAHAIGTPEQQVCIRIGDVLLYATHAETLARIRQTWHAQQRDAARLPGRVPRTWLPQHTGTYPPSIALRLIPRVRTAGQYVPADQAARRPAHLSLRVESIVWQICDRTALESIHQVWQDAHWHLDPIHA